MEATAKALADRMIKYFGFPEERRDLLAFGLTYVFLYVVDVTAIVVAGFVAGALGLTLVAAASAAVFRAFTGGAHFSDPWSCAVISAVLSAALGSVAGRVTLGVSSPAWVAAGSAVLVAVAASAANQAYAPVESSAKPLSPAQKVGLRCMAWVVLAGWGIVMALLFRYKAFDFILASSLGVLWQVLTLTPGGARLYRLVDRALGVRPQGSRQRED